MRFVLTLFAIACLIAACSESKKEGSRANKGALEPEDDDQSEVIGKASSDEKNDSEDDGRDDFDDSTTNKGNGGSPSTTSSRKGVKFEDCVAKDKSWIASQNNSAAVCGSKLVSWCCTEAEVYRRMPDAKAALDKAFEQRSGEGKKLYHCSDEGGGKIRLHFALIEKKVQYGFHAFTGYLVDVEDSEEECATLTFEDLLGDGYEPPDEEDGDGTDPEPSPTPSPETTTLTWATDINPLIVRSCGGGTCHGSGAPQTLLYEDSEAAVLADAAKIADRIGRASNAAGVMPQANSGFTLSAADKAKLLEYLNAKAN